MKTRKLQNGTEVTDLDIPITISVYTKCPWKYKLTDMETGIEYTGTMPDADDNYHWVRKE